MEQKIIETIESIATLSKQLSESDSSQGLQLLPELVNSLANLINSTGPSSIKLDGKKFAEALNPYDYDNLQQKQQRAQDIWDSTRESLGFKYQDGFNILLPFKTDKEIDTTIAISDYVINKNKDRGIESLSVEFSIMSNDYSTDKYTKFLTEITELLVDKGYLKEEYLKSK